MPKQTASQTVGPYFAYCLTEAERYGGRDITSRVLTTEKTLGSRIRIEGRVLDGAGKPVPDAMIEIWQANAAGRYAHPEDARGQAALDPSFKGFGRAGTDGDGRFFFDTIKPGGLPGARGARQAPHINVIVFARGMLVHAYTRLYFSDEQKANAADPTLSSVPEARRQTLIAGRHESDGHTTYRLDIRLQGADETVFFDV
jgi:protocatechuate 3,4-dioxygenase alpha subunit